MSRTVEVPVSLLRKLARASNALASFEDELEDYLLARDDQFIQRMRDARSAHQAGKVRPLAVLKKDLCIE